jgi:hypothetical protein
MNKRLSLLYQGIGWLCCYVGFMIVGIVMSFYPTLSSGFRQMQTDPGDTRLNHYILEHSFQVIFNPHYGGTLWSPQFFYPFKDVLSFSENLWGSAPLYWLFRAFQPVDIAYQLWMIAVVALCFASFAIVLRFYQVQHLLCALGAFLYAFGMPRQAQFSHQQLLPAFYLPLGFLAVWSFLQTPSLKRLIVALVLIYLQILAGIYLGWFFVFSLLVLLTIVWYRERPLWNQAIHYVRGDWKRVAGVSLVWIIALYLLFAPYLAIQKWAGGRSYGAVIPMIPRLNSWFLSPPQSLWGNILAPLGRHLSMVHEHYLFMGFTVLILIALGVYSLRSQPLPQARSQLMMITLSVGGGLFLLSIWWFFGNSLWRLVHLLVPGATAIRALARISLIIYFYLLLGSLLGVDALVKRYLRGSWRVGVLVPLSILAMTEQLLINPYSYDKQTILKPQLEQQALIQTGCDVAYVTLSRENPPWLDQITSMWAGLTVGVPMINGYSGFTPPNYNSTKTMNFPELASWLGKEFQGRMCLISRREDAGQTEFEASIPQSLVVSKSSTANFTLNTVVINPDKSTTLSTRG